MHDPQNPSSNPQKLSVRNARDILKNAGHDGADPNMYESRRLDGGWQFMWYGSDERPADLRGWIVADTGRYKRHTTGMLAREVLAELLAEET